MPESLWSSEERKELMTAIQDHVYQNAIRKLAKEIASTSQFYVPIQPFFLDINKI